LDPGELVAAFEDTTLVDYVLAGERLQAVVVQRSRCRLVDLGPLADVRRTTAGVRMALGTAVSAKPEAKRVGPLVEAAAAAEKALLRPLDLEDTDRMVIVTDGPLGSLPWGVLPGLAQVDVTVARSVTAWIEARAGEPSQRSDPRVLVVAGPSLQYAEQEAEEISRIWPRVTTLAGSDATIGNFLDALAEADVVHVAAHGTHRGDNPLLSAIRLADGSLTGYELSNAEKQVDTVVLSCCEVGMTETGSGIGIAQVLVQTGVRSVIASVSPVSDESAVSLTSDLHRRLARQIRPATALRQSRNTMGGPFEYPTGAGLICFGAG
jgi:hypothetical protein